MAQRLFLSHSYSLAVLSHVMLSMCDFIRRVAFVDGATALVLRPFPPESVHPPVPEQYPLYAPHLVDRLSLASLL